MDFQRSVRVQERLEGGSREDKRSEGNTGIRKRSLFGKLILTGRIRHEDPLSGFSTEGIGGVWVLEGQRE